MKLKNLKLILLIVLISLISIQFVVAADCDYTPLNTRINELETQNKLLQQINISYQEMLPKYTKLSEDYDLLLQDYNSIKNERDLFESKYLSTSLGNMTIGDFIFYMNKTETYYNSINQSITNQVTQMITIRNWTIAINVSIALVSISLIIFSKKIRKYILAKITKIKIHNEP